MPSIKMCKISKSSFFIILYLASYFLKFPFYSNADLTTFISLLNKQIVEVKSVGIIRLSESLELKNVLYIPKFSFNLLSVSALTRDIPINVQSLLTVASFRTSPLWGRLAILNSYMAYTSSTYQIPLLWIH